MRALISRMPQALLASLAGLLLMALADELDVLFAKLVKDAAGSS